jgi:hypothetical protein
MKIHEAGCAVPFFPIDSCSLSREVFHNAGLTISYNHALGSLLLPLDKNLSWMSARIQNRSHAKIRALSQQSRKVKFRDRAAFRSKATSDPGIQTSKTNDELVKRPGQSAKTTNNTPLAGTPIASARQSSETQGLASRIPACLSPVFAAAHPQINGSVSGFLHNDLGF